MVKRIISLLLVLLMGIGLFSTDVLAETAADAVLAAYCADALTGPTEKSGNVSAEQKKNTSAFRISAPTKAAIQEKWKEVTTATTIFQTAPQIYSPYTPGALTQEFLQSGLTYLNYVRYVAGLPEVSLDPDSHAQYGAVLLAAVDQLTHYPTKPADMDEAFYQKGYEITTTSNISALWGYAPGDSLQNAIQGQMDDSSSLSNLACVGHRRWLLNPKLGKISFGYAQNPSTNWQYVTVPVFDESGPGCDFDFVSWPVAGKQPTNLFPADAPWSITLNLSKYCWPTLSNIKITLTRQSDGKTWSFDSSTGAPKNTQEPYLTVENSYYASPGCIIFHPGTKNISSYSGIYTVCVEGLVNAELQPTSLTYQVDFFDINSTPVCSHEYTISSVAATCTTDGGTLHTCIYCGDSYLTDVIPALGHVIELQNSQDATCTERGYSGDQYCIVCQQIVQTGQVTPALGHKWDEGIVTTAPTEMEEGIKTFTCTRCGETKTKPVPPLGSTPCNGGEDCPSAEFADVNTSAWYHEGIDFAIANGLMNGLGNGNFEPDGTMTRAMLVTVLWRYAGEVEAGTNTFDDVQEGQWYTKAVAWAAEEGVVNGVGSGKFDPNGSITREQMAAILYRYAEIAGIDRSERADLSIFPDANKVSSYATDALSWANAVGLVTGSRENDTVYLLPQGNATRAQVATILMRFIENVA